MSMVRYFSLSKGYLRSSAAVFFSRRNLSTGIGKEAELGMVRKGKSMWVKGGIGLTVAGGSWTSWYFWNEMQRATNEEAARHLRIERTTLNFEVETEKRVQDYFNKMLSGDESFIPLSVKAKEDILRNVNLLEIVIHLMRKESPTAEADYARLQESINRVKIILDTPGFVKSE